jgi:hypothetical protein
LAQSLLQLKPIKLLSNHILAVSSAKDAEQLLIMVCLLLVMELMQDKTTGLLRTLGVHHGECLVISTLQWLLEMESAEFKWNQFTQQLIDFIIPPPFAFFY